MKQYSKYKNSGIDWLGNIPEHWEVKRVKDVFLNLDYLREPIAADMREQNNPIYDYYGASGVIDKIDYYNVDDTVLLVSEDGANLLSRNLPLVYKANGKIWVNNHAHILKPINANYDFMFYALENLDYSVYITGSAQPKLSQDNLNRQWVQFPPLSEQTSIAAYLDEKTANIDRRIELLRNKIDNYKQLRRSLISLVVTRGLNPDVKLKYSGIEWLGDVPEGWVICRLKDYCKINARIGWNGLRSEEFLTKGYAYLVTGQDFKQSTISWKDCYQIDQERYEEDPLIQLSNGDILITKDGTIGKIAMVSNLDKPACLNSGIFVLKQKGNKFIQKYLYWLLVSKVFVEFNSYNKNGTTIMHLYQNVFDKMPMCIPPLTEQTAIAAYLDDKTAQIDSIIGKCEKQIEQLSALRRSLIAEAVTGKIKVC